MQIVCHFLNKIFLYFKYENFATFIFFVFLMFSLIFMQKSAFFVVFFSKFDIFYPVVLIIRKVRKNDDKHY